MRITPLDVRKQEFRRSVRGLDPDEVHAFLATVADEYEAVLTDNKQLRDKVIELDEKVAEYRNMERTLRDTLLTAERVMTEARQNARKEAELIMRDAQVKAHEATADIQNRVDALRSQMRELRGQRDAFLARLQSLAESQIGLAASYRKDFQSDDDRTDRLMRDPDPTSRTATVPTTDTAPTPRTVDTGPAEPTATSTPPIPTPADDAPPSESAIPTPDAPITDRGPEPPTTPRPTDPTPPRDTWREYDLDAPAAPPAAPVDVGVTPGPEPTDDASDPDDAAIDRVTEAWSDTVVESASESEPEPAPAWHPDEEPSAPASTMERAEAAGQSLDAILDEHADPRDASTTPSDASTPPSTEDSATSAEGDEDSEESRWSLHRFTRGLANF